MLDKIKNYAKHYENEVRDISNQLRDEMMPELSRELFDEYEITKDSEICSIICWIIEQTSFLCSNCSYV